MSQPPDPTGSPWAPTGAAVPPPPPAAAAWGVPGSGPDVPLVAVATHEGGPKRSKGKLIGGLVGVVALVAAGTFAVVKITGNDADGGAASPEDVGTSLTDALDNEDALGVIDLLLPGERDTFRQPLIDLFEHLRRLDVLATDASLDKIGGVDITFSDVSVRTETTNVDDIANIFLSGESTITINGDQVPLGDLLIDEAFGGDRPDMDAAPDSAAFDDQRFTVVRDGGRWYLSAFYSIAEATRGKRDIPTDPVTPTGADSPEGALDALLADVSDLDLEGVISDLDPTEAAALQRYAPLFLDDATSRIDDSGLTWRIDHTAYSVNGSDDRRSVDVDHLELEATLPDSAQAIRVVVDKGCVEVTVDGTTERNCVGDLTSLDGVLSDLGDGEIDQSLRDVIETVQDAFADYDPSGIAVHQVDGRWFVSPLRSAFDGLDSVLTALDRQELSDIIDALRAFGESFGSFDIDDPLGSLDTGDTGTGDGTADDGTGDEDPFTAVTACYAAADAAAGVQCFQDGIADGSIDPTFVSVPLRHPECGVAEAYWGSLYGLSDQEFVDLVAGASPCFLKLIETGEVDKWEVPDELLAPDCVEGRNWYAVFDDEAYNQRVFECAAKVRDSL